LKRKIGIGLIGCGSIAEESHLPAIKRIPAAKLIAVADSDESRAQLASQNFGAEYWYGNYEALLENEQVDAVDVCTPTKYHADVVVAAAKAGKHVLCEKPIALSVEDADRMIYACAEHKVNLMVAHSRRFIPRYSIAREIVRMGRIGKPIWATQISRRTIAEPSSWYFDPNMTLGPIAEVGIHEADLLRWILTDEVVEVRGMARARDATARVYDQIFAALKFSKGTVASFEVGYVLPKSFPQYTTLEILGSKGIVSASDNHMNVVTQGAETGITYPLAYSGLLSVNSAYESEIIAFIDSVINGTHPPVTGDEARAALEIILALQQSIANKKMVKLPLKKAK
jgi:predicted dehydrogenase